MVIQEVLDLGLPRIGGCICADGAFESHTAALFEPYADEPDNYGTLTYTQEEMSDFILRAHQAGLQAAIHCEADRAIEQVLYAYERALRQSSPEGSSPPDRTFRDSHREPDRTSRSGRHPDRHAALLSPGFLFQRWCGKIRGLPGPVKAEEDPSLPDHALPWHPHGRRIGQSGHQDRSASQALRLL